jgi:predicted dehydrogenase
LKSRIGVGVIGCGVVAQVMHLHYLREVEGLCLAGLCDLSPGQLRAVAGRHGVAPDRCYTDYRELIARPDVDAVMVLTAGSHAEPAIAAAEAGKHVFVEKPLCYTPCEADRMIAAAEAAGVTLMVGYMKAYDPTYQTARALWQDMARRNEVGLIRVHDVCHDNAAVVADMYGSAVVQAQKDDLGPEVRERLAAEIRAKVGEALDLEVTPAVHRAYSKFLGLLTHDTSILMLTFGQPRRVVSAEVWDEGHGLVAVLDYGENVRCVVETARGAQHWMDESIAVLGPKRQATLEFPSPYQRNGATVLRVGENAGPGYAERRVVSSLEEAFKRELVHFRDCVRSGERPLTDGEVGKQNVLLGIEIVRRAFRCASPEGSP